MNQRHSSLTTENDVSLQDAFEKFRKQKAEEMQLKILMNEKNMEPKTEAQKQALREKFILTAKKYLGVPYHPKYKAPDAELAPLYLDCCGLVRQCVRDLHEDFGFLIGNWNQAYQFDCLPEAVNDIKSLAPGDLIFYEGKYVSDRSKKQKHDMVHVEIFLGGETGEATIGARFMTGVIEIFPSYNFVSSKWTLVKHHFKSLDPWLDGACKSCCSEHNWYIANTFGAGRRSIFAPQPDDEPAEQQLLEQEERTVDEVDGKGDGDGEEDNSLPLPPRDESSGLGPDQSKSQVPLPSEAGRGPDSGPQRTTKRRPKSVILDAAKSGSVVAESVSRKSNSVVVKRSSSGAVQQPLTYFVLKSNGWRLVKDALDKRGWVQLPFDYSFTNRFNLKWVERRSQIDYRAHSTGQLVNHIPNNDVLTTKTGLLHTMRDFYCTSKSPRPIAVGEPLIPPWLPETYDLSFPADCFALLRTEEQGSGATGLRGMYMYKPSSSNRGRGLRVLRGLDALKEVCVAPVAVADESGPSKAAQRPAATPTGIVQRYIKSALLADGYKFDIRCYMHIARTSPTFLVYYHPGYCRMTLLKYEDNEDDNPYLHLTNASVQKHHPLYESRKEHQIQLPSVLADTMQQCGDTDGANFMRNELDEQIKLCMVDVIKAAIPKLLRKSGYFDLLGLDFMVEVDRSDPAKTRHRLLLLEVNTNPALSLDNETLANLLPTVVDGAIGLVLAAQGPGSSDASIGGEMGGFELIYDEASGFQFARSQEPAL